MGGLGAGTHLCLVESGGGSNIFPFLQWCWSANPPGPGVRMGNWLVTMDQGDLGRIPGAEKKGSGDSYYRQARGAPLSCPRASHSVTLVSAHAPLQRFQSPWVLWLGCGVRRSSAPGKEEEEGEGPLRGEEVKALDSGQKGVPRQGLGVPGDDGGQGTTNEQQAPRTMKRTTSVKQGPLGSSVKARSGGQQ